MRRSPWVRDLVLLTLFIVAATSFFLRLASVKKENSEKCDPAAVNFSNQQSQVILKDDFSDQASGFRLQSIFPWAEEDYIDSQYRVVSLRENSTGLFFTGRNLPQIDYKLKVDSWLKSGTAVFVGFRGVMDGNYLLEVNSEGRIAFVKRFVIDELPSQMLSEFNTGLPLTNDKITLEVGVKGNKFTGVVNNCWILDATDSEFKGDAVHFGVFGPPWTRSEARFDNLLVSSY